MQRLWKTQENPRFELTSVDGNRLCMNAGTDRNANEVRLTSPKPKLRSTSAGPSDGEKIVEIRQLDLNYDGGKTPELPRYKMTSIDGNHLGMNAVETRLTTPKLKLKSASAGPSDREKAELNCNGGKTPELRRYEMMTSFGGSHLNMNADTDSKTSGEEFRLTTPKPKPKSASDGQTDREMIVEIPQIGKSYDGGVHEIIANKSKVVQQGGKQGSGGERPDAVYESLDVMIQATQQQMDLSRRMMYLIALLLVIVFLTAGASLTLTVMVMMSEKSFSLHQPASSTAGLPKCVENVYVHEVSTHVKEALNATRPEVTHLKEALNATLHQVEELKNQLDKQNKTMAMITSKEKKFQHLADQLESTRSELTSLKAHLAGHVTGLCNASNSTSVQLNQLKSVWIAVNATAEVSSNLTKKIGDELNNVWRSVNGSNATLSELVSSLQVLKMKMKNETETVWLNLNQTKKCCTDFKSSLQSFQQNVTYRSKRLEARIEIEEQKSNSSNKVAEYHFKKIQDVEELLNSTRQDAKEAFWQHLAALWSAGNSTKKEIQKVWTAVNTSQSELNKGLMKVKHNFTDQLNLTTVLLKSSDSSLFALLIKVNASITEKVISVSKMAGPIGPPGFNGSQGPAGPAGSIGPPGPKGAGDFSSCQYKVIIEPPTPGDPVVIAGLNEPSGKRVLGASCSTNFAAEYNLFSILDGNVRRYSCICKGTSNFFSPSLGQQKSCSLHYWECPMTTLFSNV